MKKQTIVSIIIGLMTFIVIFLVGIVALNKTQTQFFQFCADKEWKGIHKISGDFSDDIDCEAMWKDNFADGKWTEKCSDFPITTKPSCRWLCVQDCMIKNKQAGELRCVC